tara:strand:+ start:2564 stop:3133 length:570 start_codon:yes stop_codon:yes gene_type:complete
MSERILFISGRCPHSKQILIGIHKYEFMKTLFKIINIDTQPFPNYIKTVPCLLINQKIISGNTLFEYFGKLVEGKKEQEQRSESNQLQNNDQGQCRINEDGELEGWCGTNSSVEYSMITEDNDDYTKKNYKIQSDLSFLEGVDDSSLQGQIQHMEQNDQQLGHKKQQFDNDYERLQKERGEIGNGMARR